MPRPPPLGIGRSCALRGPGRSIRRAAIISRTVAADNRASPAAKVRWRRSAAKVMEAWGAKEERGEKMESEVRGEKQATEVRGETDTPSP